MSIFDKITELVYDEKVKSEAIRLLNKIIKLFPEEVQFGKLTEMILRKMNIVEETMMLALSENFGDIIQQLQHTLIDDEENLEKVFMYFKSLSQHSNIQIRKNFIYNLPGFLIIT